jgi:hypothetical protein
LLVYEREEALAVSAVGSACERLMLELFSENIGTLAGPKFKRKLKESLGIRDRKQSK